MAFVISTIGRYSGSAESITSESARSCIVLTATIAPPRAAVARNDPRVRLQDYLSSIEFYLSLPTRVIDRILFVDNSGSDIAPIEEFVVKRVGDKVVELISFEGNDHPVSYGKAYGEFKLLDFGLKHTSLLSESDHFWKVTGRLRVLNLPNLVAAVENRYDVVCDLHHFPFVGTGKGLHNRWMDLRLFSCKRSAYQKIFAGKYLEYGPETNQEILYDIVMEARRELGILPRFSQQPIISGMSGRHDREYHSGVQKLKTALRTAIRKFVPFIWV